MRIDKLALTAFGRFRLRSIELSPGLNIIYGDNEAGKSTLQRFILGMLYGFKKQSQRRDYTEDLARYRPWQGDDYRGAMTYTLDRTGRSFRVGRLFDPKNEEVRVYDAVTGADLTARFQMDRRKELLFAEEHMRLPEEVFRSTAWVGQMLVGRLEVNRELVNRMANMQESGREDLSVRSALRWLEESMRAIGTERAPTRPYGRTVRLIDEKRQELDRVVRAREQTQEWEAGLAEVRSALAATDAALDDLHRRLAWAQLWEIEVAVERVASSERSAQEARARANELSRYASFPVHLREQVIRALTEMKAAQEQGERIHERLATLDEERQALRSALGHLEGMTEVGESAFRLSGVAQEVNRAVQAQLDGLQDEQTRLTDMISRLDEAIEPLMPIARLGTEGCDRLEEIEKEQIMLEQRSAGSTLESLHTKVNMLNQEVPAGGSKIWLIASAVGVAFAGGVPAGLGKLMGLTDTVALASTAALGALAVLSLLIFLAFRSKGERLSVLLHQARNELQAAQQTGSQDRERMALLQRERENTMGLLGVTSAAEARNRLIRYEQLNVRREGQQSRLQAVQEEIARLQTEIGGRSQDLKRMLAQAMGLPPEEVTADAEQMEHFGQMFEIYQQESRRVTAIEREYAETLERFQQAQERAAVFEQEMQQLLAQAGVDDPARFGEACALHDAWQKIDAEAATRETTLRLMTGGESVESLTARAERLRAELVEPAPERVEQSALLREEIRQHEAQRSELAAQASDLNARIETALRGMPAIADLYQELHSLLEEQKGYDDEIAALTLARATIADVAEEIHREFAPQLNRAVSEIVTRLTRGKYREIRIDEEMTMRVIADNERLIDILALSAGTIDQIYFGLRIALLDLITQQQERIPLILDDPFVQYDDHRLRACIELIGDLSRERQVILMTCHRRELEMAQQMGIPVTVIDISDTHEAAAAAAQA